MRSLGVTLIILGLGSMVLNYLGIYFIVLYWIDNWGSNVGWAIRGGLVGLGVLMVLLGRRHD
ncbi:MAG: hypothetical protein IT437_09195 [Phycisphaerales bacterium]|nr:hypothetical protein [Phycisphaerales bacterium]